MKSLMLKSFEVRTSKRSLREMRAKTIGLIAAVAAVPVMSGIATASVVLGDTLTLTRTSIQGRATVTNYDSSRSWNASGVT
ncbi:MAG: hypothetical protein QMB94_13590, partial [Phycisphaerales bacterium]